MEHLIHGQGATHKDITVSFHNLGCILHVQGKLVEAEAMYWKSRNMEYSLHDQDAEQVGIAVSLGNIASVFTDRGRVHVRKVALHFVFNPWQNEMHVKIAASLDGLGLLFRALGKLLFT